ncbi:MAG: F0F1 ATP synthase subunit beta [Candidatus Omnitrophota bacterium]|nr:MAG: F0F1 ATP synthase subunit beta [Candidatus Omnitrophota bacterium]
MENIGRIISVYGPVIEVQFDQSKLLPGIYEILYVKNCQAEDVTLEVIEHGTGNICRCIALSFTYGLQRNAKVFPKGEVLSVPDAAYLYGRVVDALGIPIDGKGDIKAESFIPVHQKITHSFGADAEFDSKVEILGTGIKIVDLLFPLVKGAKTGILGGAALGKSVLILEIIHNVIKKQEGVCVFSGIGERIREGNELYYEFLKKDLLKKSILVFGQMNESPGVRFESANTSIAIAESLMQERKDVLFFVDNVFRFAQAGSEISALLGRIPSETGYQSTLTSEIGNFHERISRVSGGSITSIEAVYVPADDVTDPAVVTIFSHLNSVMTLSRTYVQRGLYPAINPLESTSSFLSPDIIGEKHYCISQEVLKYLQKYDELQRIASIIGKEELTHEERLIFDRARKLQNFLTQPFFVVEDYIGIKGVYVTLNETLAGCEKIISGDFDTVNENKFYMISSIDSIQK